MTDESVVSFPARKLWGFIPMGKPMVISVEAIIIKGVKLYFRDITSIEKSDKWIDNMIFFPISLSTDSGKTFLVNLGSYAIRDVDGFFDTLVSDWRRAQVART